MKTIVDTPEFTAWLLGELPQDQAAAMERAVAADPAMQLAAREQQQFLQSVTGWMGGAQESLDARQREKIMSTARSQASDVIVAMPQKRSAQSWGWISMATAAVAVIGVSIGLNHPLKPGKSSVAWDDVTREIALLPTDATGFPEENQSTQSPSATAVGGTAVSAQRDVLLTRQPDEYLRVMAQRIAAEPLPSAAELPTLRERGFVDASKSPQAPLPLHVGSASWNWVKRSITEQQKLPHASLVRSEEILNAFRFDGGQELQRHGCVVRAEGFAVGSNRSRLVVSLRNESNSAQSLTWSYEARPDSRYRLVGFGAPSTTAKSSALLAAGSSVTIMLEVEASNPADGLGALIVVSGGREDKLPIAVASSPSAEAAFFSLMTDYAAWLRQPNADSSDLLKAVQAQELLTPTPEQLMALSIIKKSVALGVSQ